jgi:hypothetical protein
MIYHNSIRAPKIAIAHKNPCASTMIYHNSTTRGFVALVAILIFSTILLIIVVSLSRYGIVARFALLEIERKTESEVVASSCISVVRVMVVDDPLLTATHLSVPVRNHTCTIESIIGAGAVRRAKVSSVIEGATTHYLVDINPTTGTITRFIEAVE